MSRGPPSVGSISVSQEHEQLSKVPPVVESTSSCPKYLQLSRVIFVRQGALYQCDWLSCRSITNSSNVTLNDHVKKHSNVADNY